MAQSTCLQMLESFLSVDGVADTQELSWIDKLWNKKPKEKGIIDEYEHAAVEASSRHHTSDILLCGVLSGAIAGFMTNGLETLAVKKQTKRNFSIRKHLSKPGKLGEVMLQGAVYRTCYYGI